MRMRTVLAAVAVVALTTLQGITGSAASAPVFSDPGVLGVSAGGTWADTLTFNDPNVTATFTVTNTAYQAGLGDSTCMVTDICG